MSDLPEDICESHHHGDECSVAANDSIHESKAAIRAKVWAYICGRGDATCDEAEVTLAIRHQTCSARFTELYAEGLIVRTGEKRKTRSGRNAHVYLVSRAEDQQKAFSPRQQQTKPAAKKQPAKPHSNPEQIEMFS